MTAIFQTAFDLGILPLQNHEFAIEELDTDKRHILKAVRLKSRDTQIHKLGHDRDVREGGGDLTGGYLWLPESEGAGTGAERRFESGWRFAWPAKAWTKNTMNRINRTEGDPVPTPTGPYTHAFPIFDKNYNHDFRFAREFPFFPQGKCYPRIAGNAIGILLDSARETEQEPLWMHADPRLIAPHNDGDGAIGSRVADLNKDDEIDPDRCARLQSLTRVVYLPPGTGAGACANFHGENTLSLNITEGGRKDVHGGLWTDWPIGTSIQGTPRAHGFFSWLQGGPLVAGNINDRHNRGMDGDGYAINSGHLHLETALWKSNLEDGPNEYDGVFDTPRLPNKVPESIAPFATAVMYEFRPSLPDTTNPCGKNPPKGKYAWRAASYIYTPSNDGRVPGPNPQPDPNDDPGGGGFPPPPGGLPLPPDEGFGGGGLPGGPLPGLPFAPPVPPVDVDDVSGSRPSAGEFTTAPLPPLGIGPFEDALPDPAPFDSGRPTPLTGPNVRQRVFNSGEPANKITAFTLELAGSVRLARPQRIDPRATDFRNYFDPTPEQIFQMDEVTPITGRREAFGGQGGKQFGPHLFDDPLALGSYIKSEPWNYTDRPRQDRFTGGTACGGWVMMAPELDLADFGAIRPVRSVEPPFDDELKGWPPRANLSEVYDIASPGTYWAAGFPELAEGKVFNGYRWGTDADGNLTFDCVGIDGAINPVLVMTKDCTVDLSGPIVILGPTKWNVVSIDFSDSPYSVLTTDFAILADTDGGTIEVDLPAASTMLDQRVFVKKTAGASSKKVNINADGAETIDGAGTFILTNKYDGVEMLSDGANWHVISNI